MSEHEITAEDLQGLPDALLKQLGSRLIKKLLGEKEWLRLFGQNSQQVVLLEAITEGPLTCADAADILGGSLQSASAILSDLYRHKLITRNRKVPLSTSGKPGWLYEAL